MMGSMRWALRLREICSQVRGKLVAVSLLATAEVGLASDWSGVVSAGFWTAEAQVRAGDGLGLEESVEMEAARAMGILGKVSLSVREMGRLGMPEEPLGREPRGVLSRY